jgi:hypothetical protein
MPRKVFTAGEVLAAADVNSFLMDQSVMVFAGTAARGSAIASPTEGMYTHLSDTDTLTYYNGSAWVNAVPAGGLTLLASQTFTAATSIIIDNVFSSLYNSYLILMNATTSTVCEVYINWRAATVNATTNYSEQFVQGNSSAVTGFRTGGSSSSLGRFDTSGGLVSATINGVALAQRTYGVSQSMDSSSTIRSAGMVHTTATAYDGFRISVGSSTGQVRVYGLEN